MNHAVSGNSPGPGVARSHKHLNVRPTFNHLARKVEAVDLPWRMNICKKQLQARMLVKKDIGLVRAGIIDYGIAFIATISAVSIKMSGSSSTTNAIGLRSFANFEFSIGVEGFSGELVPECRKESEPDRDV